MPIWDTQNIDFDVDAVLRGQGAEPRAIRKRSPRLVDLAERALEEAQPLLKPRTLFLELKADPFSRFFRWSH